MAPIRRRVIVSGMVQGVNFRAYTRARARQAQTRGWVRNLPDGRVEAVIEGEAENVAVVVDWCRKGPPFSRVDHVKVYEEHPTGEFTDFDISYIRGEFF